MRIRDIIGAFTLQAVANAVTVDSTATQCDERIVDLALEQHTIEAQSEIRKAMEDFISDELYSSRGPFGRRPTDDHNFAVQETCKYLFGDDEEWCMVYDMENNGFSMNSFSLDMGDSG